MSTGEILGYIVVPLAIFLLSSAGAAIIALVKGSAYMARSQVAQEETAKSNEKIATNLEAYMTRTDATLISHETRLAVHSEQIAALQNGRRPL